MRNQKTEVCPYCKILFQKANIHKHINSCKENPDRISVPAWNKGLHTGSFQNYYQFICEYCKKEWMTTRTGYKVHTIYCICNPNRKNIHNFGIKRTAAEKEKISIGQKLAHKEGRNSSWIGRRKRSYAEDYWYNIFLTILGENTFKNNFPVKTDNSCYFLDFAWVDKKIYFEVDGESHYSEEGIKHDIKRTSYLESCGWKLIDRCRWSEYQKLSFQDKNKYIDNIINKIQLIN